MGDNGGGFPAAQWGEYRVRFEAGPGEHAPGDWAVVVFARAECGFVLAYVPGRGWTTPSGRIEPGETAAEAARRETYEEIGAELSGVRPIGRYFLTDAADVTRTAAAFVGLAGAYGDIPPGSEAQEARCVPPGALAQTYYFWDALMARMFQYADECAAEAAREGPKG